MQPDSFAQHLFTTVDRGGQAHLSDHCPISVALETIGTTEGDPIAVVLDRLDALQAELRETRRRRGFVRVVTRPTERRERHHRGITVAELRRILHR